MSPMSLSKNAQKEGDFVAKKSGAASPEVQMVRENGVVKAVPVDNMYRVYEQEADLERGLTDYDVVNDPVRTGVGQHLDQQVDRPSVGSMYQKQDDVRVSNDVYAIINQAIDKIVDDNQDCYGQGWEHDAEFISATVELVLAECDFDRNDVYKAIKRRLV